MFVHNTIMNAISRPMDVWAHISLPVGPPSPKGKGGPIIWCPHKVLPRPKPIVTALCIPRMDVSISRDYIYSIFNRLNVGHIEHMNEIPLRNESDYKRVILRIRWNQSPTAMNMRQFLSEKGYVNIVYDMPWFWKVVIQRA